MDYSRFHGSITALVTPFHNRENHEIDTLADTDIDWPTYEKLIKRQIAEGTKAIVPCGTTGESPSFSDEEHTMLIKYAVKIANGRIPVIAGTGSNSTRKTIEYTQKAKDLGADAAMIVVPYYNKPTQEGLYHHFKAINDAVDIPIIIYNVPSRAIADISIKTLARLAPLPNIIGIKDASGDLSRVKQTAQIIGADFVQLTGEDAITHRFLEEGGHGAISVTANVVPSLCAAMHNAWQKGDKTGMHQMQNAMMPLHDALFIETSPQPLKYAMSALGLCSETSRLPMVPASDKARVAVDMALGLLGLHKVDTNKPRQSMTK